MKAGIYCPYLDILGGGEKYVFDIADFLGRKRVGVDFFWDKRMRKVKKYFNLDLKGVRFLPNIFKRKKNLLERYRKLGGYQLFFYVTDGSLFLGPAEKNILIIQSPAHVPKRTIGNIMKIRKWQLIFCYSEFVKKYILKKWQREVNVLAPAVDVDVFKAKRKENIILSVGRFTQSLHCKKQEVLIGAFKELAKSFPNWRLVLSGGLKEEDRDYFDSLKEEGKGFKIDFYPNADFVELRDFYARARIYWHAAGYGENLEKHPEKAEHFGITTIEAMASRCLVVVFKGGGQMEIVNEGKNGFFWEKKDELIELTGKIMKNYQGYQEVREKAVVRSKDFSKETFNKKLNKLLWD